MTCKRTGWATRLRKSGRKRDSRGTCEHTGWATRLKESGGRRTCERTIIKLTYYIKEELGY